MKLKIPFGRTIQNKIRMMKLQRYIYSQNWTFSDSRIAMILSEMQDWRKNYLPIDIDGKIVLDAGAGEGETALFYLSYGAKKVICIEPSVDCHVNLFRNADKFPIIPVTEPFSISMLDFDYDFMKMDIEGYEESLLNVDLDKPAVIEIHGQQQFEKFEKKGWKVKKSRISETVTCTAYGYWMC